MGVEEETNIIDKDIAKDLCGATNGSTVVIYVRNQPGDGQYIAHEVAIVDRLRTIYLGDNWAAREQFLKSVREYTPGKYLPAILPVLEAANEKKFGSVVAQPDYAPSDRGKQIDVVLIPPTQVNQ